MVEKSVELGVDTRNLTAYKPFEYSVILAYGHDMSCPYNAKSRE